MGTWPATAADSTPGSARTRSSNMFWNWTTAASSLYASPPTANCAVKTWLALKPASALVRVPTVRIIRAAPVSSTSATATSAATSVRCARPADSPAVVLGSEPMALASWNAEIRSAGTRPNSSPVTMDTTAREGEHAVIDADTIHAWQRDRRERREAAQQQRRKADSKHAAGEAQAGAFGQHLTDQAAATGAKGGPNRHFRRALSPARAVGSRHWRRQSAARTHRAKQNQQRGTNRPGDDLRARRRQTPHPDNRRMLGTSCRRIALRSAALARRLTGSSLAYSLQMLDSTGTRSQSRRHTRVAPTFRPADNNRRRSRFEVRGMTPTTSNYGSNLDRRPMTTDPAETRRQRRRSSSKTAVPAGTSSDARKSRPSAG